MSTAHAHEPMRISAYSLLRCLTPSDLAYKTPVNPEYEHDVYTTPDALTPAQRTFKDLLEQMTEIQQPSPTHYYGAEKRFLQDIPHL